MERASLKHLRTPSKLWQRHLSASWHSRQVLLLLHRVGGQPQAVRGTAEACECDIGQHRLHVKKSSCARACARWPLSWMCSLLELAVSLR